MSERPIAGPVASSEVARWSRSATPRRPEGRTTPPAQARSNPARRYLTAPLLRRLDASLSDRDRAVLATLRQLRLATGEQLERLHYADTTPRQRRRALARLTEQRLIARLPRSIGGVRAGSAGSVFALDLAGQRLTGRKGPARGVRVERPWTPGLPFLAHSLAVTELYVRLVLADRSHELELLDFQAEPACWRRFQTQAGWATVKPDAAVRLGSGAYEDHWFIEVDRGTEAPATIERKAALYRAYWSTGREQAGNGVFPKVLWLAPEELRAELLIDVLGSGRAHAWRLHAVVVFEQALERLVAGAGERPG